MKKKVLWIAAVAILVFILGLIACDFAVSLNAKGRMYDDVDSVPHRKVGLVLGTSPISTWTGQRNFYFDKRINAAADLYNSGKVDWLIVSGGDYRNTEENGFDEPVAMRDSLVKQGVDSARIILDYDGTRTLNSIAKVRNVYRQDSILIISQEYHNARALYQAKHLGIDAIAYNAGTPVGMRSFMWWRNRGREVFARVKLFLDVARNVQPEIKESLAWDFTNKPVDLLTIENVSTPFGNLGNVYMFRALCQDSKGDLVLFETQGKMTFGNFIEALLAQGVTEALYTDMGQGWNYCFYRQNTNESSPKYLHNQPLPYASNFVVIKNRQ